MRLTKERRHERTKARRHSFCTLTSLLVSSLEIYRYPNDLESRANILAEHWEGGNAPEKACR